jgi:hypothetical protein
VTLGFVRNPNGRTILKIPSFLICVPVRIQA